MLSLIVVVHHFVYLLVTFCIKHIKVLCYLCEAYISAEIHLDVALLTILSSDEHNAVSSYRTVDGSGSTVLQDFH